MKIDKYYKWYINICNTRKIKILDKSKQYCELHHIIPKSLNGTNNKENLVLLTAREHYICHCLLVKHFYIINDLPSYNKMLLAWNRMSHDNHHIKINSYLYEKLKLQNQIRAKKFRHTKESLIKCRNSQLGKKESYITKLKISNSLKGKKRSNETKEKIAISKKDTTIIYNPKTNKTKQIKIQFLNNYINEGWLHQHSPEFKKHKQIETSGKNNPTYGKRWIFNIKTDETKYVDARKAYKIINNDTNWKFGYSQSKLLKLKTRKTRGKATIEELKIKSEKMKNKVWMLIPNSNKRIRVNLDKVKEYIQNGYTLKSKKYKNSDFI